MKNEEANKPMAIHNSRETYISESSRGVRGWSMVIALVACASLSTLNCRFGVVQNIAYLSRKLRTLWKMMLPKAIVIVSTNICVLLLSLRNLGLRLPDSTESKYDILAGILRLFDPKASKASTVDKTFHSRIKITVTRGGDR